MPHPIDTLADPAVSPLHLSYSWRSSMWPLIRPAQAAALEGWTRPTGRPGVAESPALNPQTRALELPDRALLALPRPVRIVSMPPLPRNPPTALVVGFGAIGRAVFGELFRESGFRVVGVGRTMSRIAEVNSRRAFALVTDEHECRTVRVVDGVRMLHTDDEAGRAHVFSTAGIMGLALPVGELEEAAAQLVSGFKARAVRMLSDPSVPPLPCLIALNSAAGGQLVAEVLGPALEALDPDLRIGRVAGGDATQAHRLVVFSERCGREVAVLVSTVVNRIARVEGTRDHSVVFAEPASELIVERIDHPVLRRLSRVRLVDHLERYEQLKLYVSNAAHAILAYMGAAGGYQYVDQAAADPQIRAEVDQFIRGEALPALEAHWQAALPEEAAQEYRTRLLERFSNQWLRDPIARVARNPLRKLGPQDRLIGLARLCLAHQIDCPRLTRGIAHALMYHEGSETDLEPQVLRDLLHRVGVGGVMQEVSGLTREDAGDLIQAIEVESEAIALRRALSQLGIALEPETGRISYREDFQPLELRCDLIFVRHGQTHGNIEPRIFQGDVDAPTLNQLTAYGVQQAARAAVELQRLMQERSWTPAAILVSPLGRARDTAKALILEMPWLKERLLIDPGIREMSFGAWDNRRVVDFPSDHVCHRFYREQDAMVRAEGGESFVHVLLRAHDWLRQLNERYPEGATGRKRVIAFSHSMFGAACAILTGHGKVAAQGHLGFDGEFIFPHAQPFFMSGAR